VNDDASGRWKVLALTATAMFMAFLDVTIVNIAFPDMQRSFDEASLSDLSWVLNAYNVVFAALLVPAGRFADRFGRRRVFLIGLWTFLAGSVASGAAPSVEILVAARVLQAAGAAIMVPTSLALVLERFPTGERATATGLWGGAGGVAAAAGPSLGGALIEASNWRLVFLLNIPIAIATAAAAHRLLPRDRGMREERLPDPVGVALLAAGTGALALGIVKGPDWGWGEAPVVLALAAAAVLLVAFVWRSRVHPAPVVELSLFRLRSFALANAATLVFSLAFYALLLSVVLFMTEVWGYSYLRAGFALTVGPLTGAAFAALGGRLADRLPPRVVAVPGCLAFVLGCALYAALLDHHPNFLGAYLPGAVATGAGIGLTFAALTSTAVAELPPTRFATGTAVVSCARQIGAVLGISSLIALLQTAAADPLPTFVQAWTWMAIAGGAAAGLALALPSLRPAREAAAGSAQLAMRGK
jgi:EmrB/QacA subfamily drug resistance transporter